MAVFTWNAEHRTAALHTGHDQRARRENNRSLESSKGVFNAEQKKQIIQKLTAGRKTELQFVANAAIQK
jgi:hypothetical protein